MADKEEILDVLRRAVTAKDVSQCEVARLSGLSQGHISKLVRNKCDRPRRKTVDAINAAMASRLPEELDPESFVIARVRALANRGPQVMHLLADMMLLVERFADLDRLD